CTPDLLPTEVTGSSIFNQKTAEFEFRPGPIFTHVILADEVNRATPRTQAALLECMAEHQVSVDGVTYDLPLPFVVLATQNPIDLEGTYPLPEAQLDRFFFKLVVGYSGREELAEILQRTATADQASVSPALDAAKIERYQQLVRRVAIAPHVRDYAVRMVLATHPRDGRHGGGQFATPLVNEFVRLGASPRAAQALELAAKCRALLDSRTAVSTDDIAGIALPALRHRIILNFEGEAEGVTTDSVIENIAATLPVETG
ncbi:MAG: AAA family ATPase, partial [Phycisphaerales bacterium]|nr:AAA family ATPase [Phycisphaerales bacterium]